MTIRNYIYRLFVALLLAVICVPANAEKFSQTYTISTPFDDSIWRVLFHDGNKTGYFLLPNTNAPYGQIMLFQIFKDKTISSAVTITLNVGVESGSKNPSLQFFSLYADTDCTIPLTFTKSGTMPTTTDFNDLIFTIGLDQVNNLSDDLVIQYSRSSTYFKQLKFYSVTVEFEYEAGLSKSETSLSFGDGIDGETISKTFAFGMEPISTPATLTGGPDDAVITYESNVNSVATVSDKGVVTIHKPGITTISASFAEDDNYKGSSCSYTLDVAKMQSEISFSETTIHKQVGDADFSCPPQINVEDAPLTFASSNTNVATVDDNGLIHVVGSGFADITATCPENDYWLESSATFSLVVTNPNAGGNEYVLVTSIDQLEYGDQLLFTDYNHNYVMSKQELSNWSSITSETDDCGFSFSTDKKVILVTNPENVAVLTLEQGTKDNTFAFRVAYGYLYASTSDGSGLKTQADIDDNASALIVSITSSGTSDIQFQGNNTCNLLRFNNGINIKVFSCYAQNNANQRISIYKLLKPQAPASEELTLKQLIEKADANEKTIYTISNELRGVAALPGNVLLAKDADGEAVEKANPQIGWTPYTINAVSYFSDADAAEHANTTPQNLYDQSNWVEIKLPPTLQAADYVNKMISAGSVKGYYTDALNPSIELATDVTLTISGDAEPYERNAMCPANFMGTSQQCANHANHGTYFFNTPKPNELVQVVWAVYDGGAFYIPMTEANVNVHGFKGGFDVNLAYNITQELDFTEGSVYQFKAVVKKAPTSAQSTKRKVISDTREKCSTYVVYPLNLEKGIITSVSDFYASKAEKSHRYFNCMGAELTAPAPGITIEVITYTDGSSSSRKIIQ